MDPTHAHPPAAAMPSSFHFRWRWRYLTGIALMLAALAIVLSQIAQLPLWQDPRMQGALLGGSMAALATALGTLPVLLSQKFSQRSYDTMLGFGAGVMLAASSFSLIIPALAAARPQGSRLAEMPITAAPNTAAIGSTRPDSTPSPAEVPRP